MKLRRDSESGILVPVRERIWTPHRQRANRVGAPFFAAAAPDVPTGALRFLSHFEGVDNSAVVTDASPYNWAATGGHPAALIKTTRAKFGSSCLTSFRTVTNQGIRVGNNTPILAGRQTPPADAFSFDFWLYVVNTHPLDNVCTVFHARTSLNYLISFGVTKQNPGAVLYTNFSTNSLNEGSGTRTAITPNTWHHIAIAGNGTNIWRYHNGTLAFTGSYVAYGGTGNGMGIDLLGYYPYGSSSPNNDPDGSTEVCIDEFRAFWGYCPYDGSNFFPPVAPYPDP